MANRDINPSQGFGNRNTDIGDWDTESAYWRRTWRARPYVAADRGYEFYEPGYRYGYESANRLRGRTWEDVETDLRTGWDRYEHRGQSTWEHVKDAIRDAWDRVVHR